MNTDNQEQTKETFKSPMLDYTKESIKLGKNTKGFTWEIKLLAVDEKIGLTNLDISRLNALNEKMQEVFHVNP